jgi:hypothetical protein
VEKSGRNTFCEGGCEVFRPTSVSNHASIYHKSDMDRQQTSVVKAIDNANTQFKESIKKVLRCVYYLAKTNSPLSKMKEMCDLLRLQGLSLGNHYTNANAERLLAYEGVDEDDDCEDDGVGEELLSGDTGGTDAGAEVGPYCPAKGWSALETPPIDLKKFDWSGKKLAHIFADGWSIGTFRQQANTEVGIVQDVLDSWVFFYSGIGEVVHKLNNKHYGMTQKWVIIEKRLASRRQKKNRSSKDDQSNPYAKDYAPSHR